MPITCCTARPRSRRSRRRSPRCSAAAPRCSRAACPIWWRRSAGKVAGYSYASPYRARPAYRFAIENSVYVDPARPRAGVGRALLAALIVRCEQGDWRQMIAVIGDSANAASIGLHAALGFRHVGTLHAVGFKFGRWIDSVLMQRALGCERSTASPRSGDPGPERVTRFPRGMSGSMLLPANSCSVPGAPSRCSASRRFSPGARSSTRRS